MFLTSAGVLLHCAHEVSRRVLENYARSPGGGEDDALNGLRHVQIPQRDAAQTPVKRPVGANASSPAPPPGTPVNLSFNVPSSSNVAGPEMGDIIHASSGGFSRWAHPEGTEEGTRLFGKRQSSREAIV
ncbi:hypothetical protein W97_02611 [Coniosporium apollinis CBS 100218]|uniref:Uncharacterized protein n=1 Tax=Coniosporium apollinis (strain CBS 100218) TaxID=1168221 RepID=R7YNJ2_CONA1|nr:uncharacterized protein W97_02611 [Coniosporium apollinis CBS 100218]EON63384.1 hypothetical protein W97_02611 [Coniosporium apollinis CBS 100218]